jgi:hypothetical protein
MASAARWPTALQRLPAEYAWSACGRSAEVDVVLAAPDEPAQLAIRLGSYCLGHAVITGIEAQARAGGHIWYVACCGEEPLTSLN